MPAIATILLSLVTMLLQKYGPDAVDLIGDLIHQHKEVIDNELPWIRQEIIKVVASHSDAAATDLANRLREGAAA